MLAGTFFHLSSLRHVTEGQQAEQKNTAPLVKESKLLSSNQMIMSRDQNAERSYSMKTDNSSIERVEEFKYLGTTLTNKNYIQEEIKSRLKLRNACYYSVQNLFSSSLLSKKLKIKIYRTIILPVVLYGCETWSLTLRDERRLRVFEKAC